MKFKHNMLAASSLALVLSVNLFAQDVYTIQNKTLQEALEIISKKSHLSYIADDKLIQAKKINNIKNIGNLEEALELLFKDTGLRAVVKNETIVIIKDRDNKNPIKSSLGEFDVISATRSNLTINKSPASIKVITREEIEDQLYISSNPSDVLSNLISSYSPGRQKMNGNGETIRGRNPLILIDGVPQTNPLRPTGREIHTIDFKMVERIEVINGSTASNGIAGVGGVINIITKKPENNQISQTFNIQTTIPTSKIKSETASYKVGYSIGGQEQDFDYFFSTAYEDQGLYLDGNSDAVGVDNTQGDLMNSKSYDILSKIGYWIDDNQNIKFFINKFNIKNKNDYIGVVGDKENDILATSVRGTPIGKAPYNDTLTTKLSYNHDDFMGMNLSFMLYNQRFEGLFGATNSTSFQDINLAPIGTFYDQSRVKSTKYGSKLTLNKDGLFNDNLKLTFGFDTMFDETFQDLYLTNRTYVPKSEYNVYSPFLLASYDLTDKLTFHTGVRYEKGKINIESYTTVPRYNSVDVKGGEIDIAEPLYNAGLVYELVDNTNIFANYSEGFTLPDIGRALRSINTEGVSVSSFDNLKPIITDSYELGLRSEIGIFKYEFTIFQSDSKFGNRVEKNPYGQYILKREKTRIRGLDFALGAKLNDTNNLNFLYSYSEGEYDSDKDGTLDTKLGALNMAPNRLIGKLSSKINNQLSTYLQINHAFSRSFDDEKTEFSGYTLFDLSASYKLDKGVFSLGIANLFNKQYVTYYSQSAVNDDSRYTAGRGRSLTLGYSLKF